MSRLGGAERVAIHSLQASLRAEHDVFFISEDFDVDHVERFFSCTGLFGEVTRLSYPPFRPKLANTLMLYRQLLYHGHKIKDVISRFPNFELILSTQDVGYVPMTSGTLVQYCYYPDYFSHIQQASSSIGWKLYYSPARAHYHKRVRRIDRFLSTSNYTRALVRSEWGRDSTTIYPPCPVELYRSSSETKENLVITIGRIVPVKRMELFLQIARALPSAEFVIIGSVDPGKRNYYNSLVTEAPRNVRFVLTPLREARNLLFRAKAYVHCTRDEQFGIAIVEAMAAGCVPIVHDSGGPKEIVTDEVGFRWKSPDEAVNDLLSLMDDESLRQRLSTNASARSSLFGSEVFESRLRALIEETGSRRA